MNSTEQIESPKVEGDQEGRGDAASSEPRKQTQVHQTNTDRKEDTPKRRGNV